MYLIRKCFLMFVILGLFKPGFSQDSKAEVKLSITEAQTYALQNNRSIRSAKIDVEIANKQVWETIAIGLPQLNLAANYQHQFVIPELSFGPVLNVNSLPATGFLTKDDITNAYVLAPPVTLGVKNNTTFDFTLSQLIFSGEYLVGLQATKVFKEISEKSLIKTEEQTKELVADSYHLVLVLGENVRVLNESLKAIEKTYEELKKMNIQGFNEDTDVDQISISRSNIKTLITSLESQKDISIKLLKFQLGMEFSQPLVLTDSLPGVIDLGNLQYLASPEFNINNSVDYQMISNLEKVSVLNLRREQSKVLPSLAGFYRHHEQLNTPSFNFNVKDLIGVTLSLPIITSGQHASKVSQAKFNLEKSRLNKETTAQGLTMEFETALSSYQTAYRNFSTNKESMDLSKKGL